MSSQVEGRTAHPRRLERRVPRQRLINAVNPLVRRLASSRAHKLVDGSTLVLHVVGRRTGRCYDIPVSFIPLGGELQVVTQHRWRQNLRGGVDLDVTVRGRRQRFHADLDEDAPAVAAVLEAIVEDYGWHTARHWLGLRGSGSEPPTTAELTALAEAEDLAVVTLSSEETWTDGEAEVGNPLNPPRHWYDDRRATRYQRSSHRRNTG